MRTWVCIKRPFGMRGLMMDRAGPVTTTGPGNPAAPTATRSLLGRTYRPPPWRGCRPALVRPSAPHWPLDLHGGWKPSPFHGKLGAITCYWLLRHVDSTDQYLI